MSMHGAGRLPILFKNAEGLLWDPSYLGFRTFRRFLRRLSETEIREWRWWFGDWYVEFTHHQQPFRADTPLADANLHYPPGAATEAIRSLEQALQEQLGVVIRPGPPPLDRREWRTSHALR